MTPRHRAFLLVMGELRCKGGDQKFPLCERGPKLFIDSCVLIPSQRGGDYSRSFGSYHTELCEKP